MTNTTGTARGREPHMIVDALNLIVEQGGVTELRILQDNKFKTQNGFYNDWRRLAKAAELWSGKAEGIYFVPNRVDPQLLARTNNELRQCPEKGATTDANILRRTRLLLDFDPIRPTGISSTDQQHDLAIQKARDVAEYLESQGWCDPVLADSGNGGHLIYAIDLPTDSTLVEHVLKALASKFDDDIVKVDRSTFNPSRVWKLYGTLAAKGANMLDHPHRTAKILSAPTRLSVTDEALLLRLVESLDAGSPVKPNGKAAVSSEAVPSVAVDGAALQRWRDVIDRYAGKLPPLLEEKPWKDGGWKREFEFCPFNPEHTTSSAFVGCLPSGAIVAGCLHASCKQKNWDALKLVMGYQTTPATLTTPPSVVPFEDGKDWREGCKSFGQLSSTPPRSLLNGLIPEHALTAVPAPSYHCKTWLALQMGHAVSEGLPMFCFDVPEQVPVIYHVPEMGEALVRERMAMLGIEDSERFLVRPMELGIWPLNSPRMIESSKGRLVFLDTQGFFNEADDQNSYNQALVFANRVFNLLNQGARAVVMLTHPPKYATQRLQKEPPWTLENSIIGSAGYGGILRSCLRVRNLKLDLNDSDPWIYVQGLKNPGLKPFQLEGTPLRMKVAPGESPYLHDLLGGIEDGDNDPDQQKAYLMFKEKSSDRQVAEKLHVGNRKVAKWREQWKLEQEEDANETTQ